MPSRVRDPLDAIVKNSPAKRCRFWEGEANPCLTAYAALKPNKSSHPHRIPRRSPDRNPEQWLLRKRQRRWWHPPPRLPRRRRRGRKRRRRGRGSGYCVGFGGRCSAGRARTTRSGCRTCPRRKPPCSSACAAGRSSPAAASATSSPSRSSARSALRSLLPLRFALPEIWCGRACLDTVFRLAHRPAFRCACAFAYVSFCERSLLIFINYRTWLRSRGSDWDDTWRLFMMTEW